MKKVIQICQEMPPQLGYSKIFCRGEERLLSYTDCRVEMMTPIDDTELSKLSNSNSRHA
jgi:hypothetical protein